jgi:hypothetical protein
VNFVDAEAQRDVFDRVSEEDQVTGGDDSGRPLVRRDGAGVEPAGDRPRVRRKSFGRSTGEPGVCRGGGARRFAVKRTAAANAPG